MKAGKRKPLNPRIHISANGRPYLDQQEAVRRVLAHPPKDAAEAPERACLEKEVVEAAIREYEAQKAVSEYWRDLPEGEAARGEDLGPLVMVHNSAREATAKAVESLLVFQEKK